MTTIRANPIFIRDFSDAELEHSISSMRETLENPNVVEEYKNAIRPSFHSMRAEQAFRAGSSN